MMVVGSPAMTRAVLLFIFAAGCGGSASETPFPPEPLDVNLEAEDMSTADPYRAARPEDGKKAAPPPSAPAGAAAPTKPPR
jgi:hypothetical protein